jgi:FeS assembly SUF system protein
MTEATTTPLDDEDIELVTPPEIEAPEGHPLWPRIRDQLRTVFDPEIPTNIYELGLIYKVVISETNTVKVEMTLTSPGCPVAGEMPGWVAGAVEPIPGVRQVDVAITFEPQWGMDMMSDEAKLELGFM